VEGQHAPDALHVPASGCVGDPVLLQANQSVVKRTRNVVRSGGAKHFRVKRILASSQHVGASALAVRASCRFSNKSLTQRVARAPLAEATVDGIRAETPTGCSLFKAVPKHRQATL
jgi:hypothetical protein